MHSQRLWQRAQQHVAENRLDAAEASLRALLMERPADVPARMLLSSVCLARGRLRDGCVEAERAAQALPDDAAMIATTAMCLFRIGETTTTRACMQHPGIAASRDGEALARLAHVWQMLGEHGQALALMERALACGFDNARYEMLVRPGPRLGESAQAIADCLAALPAPKGAP